MGADPVDDDQEQRAYVDLEALLYLIKEELERGDSYDEVAAALQARGFPSEEIPRLARPPATADLHIHTNYSDGNLPPRKIVWLAKLLGLEAVAVTDHDNVSGLGKALAEGDTLGVPVLAGVELGARPGCEILGYFPDAPRFLKFLESEDSQGLRTYLAAIQDEIHRKTLTIVADVNRFLYEQGGTPDGAITEQELGEWYSGQKPYYPGTVAVLGLKRLSPEDRDRLGIHDPREFNTRVVTPALRQLKEQDQTAGGDRLADVFRMLGDIERGGVPCVSVLAHPKELLTKGRMAREEIEPFVTMLAQDYGLDGLEVNNSRDTAADTAHWLEMADRIDQTLETRHGEEYRPLLRLSLSSDFHVLAPGLATGEITVAFGELDEREGHRRGNLLPQASPETLLDAIHKRAWSELSQIGNMK